MSVDLIVKVVALLVLIGVVFWAVSVAPFIDASVKVLIKIVVVLGGALWLAHRAGVW
jgi:hypothetical protein